jgi:iron complex transport system substrate-binding protein
MKGFLLALVSMASLAGGACSPGGAGAAAEPQAAAAERARPGPERILPANAAWVDYLSLLVGPERVVALPSEAFGYSRLSDSEGEWRALAPFPAFDAERVLALAPDLVLVHSWQNPETVAALEAAGVAVLSRSVPRTWDEVLSTLAVLGEALGEPARADALAAALQVRRAELRARARPFEGLAALTYTNLGAGGWTSGSGTTGNVLLELAGLRNAAGSFAGDVPADAERLLALAPDLIVVGRPDASEQTPPSAQFLRSEPALAWLAAVREDRIVTLAPALFTSLSPELLTGAERLVDELERLEREGGLSRR